jgi:hypothetical protein
MRTEASGVPDTGEAETHLQGTDLPAEFRYKSGISGKLVFERVNAVTWKLTNGEQTNVPTCYGHWPGYRTSKAVASVIELVPGQWLARYRDQNCGPSSLREAKANALAMAKGAAGEYQISNPIAHLNGLTARPVSLRYCGLSKIGSVQRKARTHSSRLPQTDCKDRSCLSRLAARGTR